MGKLGCPQVGNAGLHSRSYNEDGEACAWCGEKPEPDHNSEIVDRLYQAHGGAFSKGEIARDLDVFEQSLQRPPDGVGELIEKLNQDIASACGLPAHLLDPSVPAPCVALTVTAKCYACNRPLDWIPAAQPALCDDCENVP